MSELNERLKRQIALLAGDDLEGEPADEARRSVVSCPDCRKHWARVRGCLDAMDRAGKEAGTVSQPSLWPAIERRLVASSVVRPRRFNGWIPALSMAAACIALMVAGQMEAAPRQDFAEGGWDASAPIRVRPDAFPRPSLVRAGMDLRRGEMPWSESAEMGTLDFESPDDSPSVDVFRSP